MYIQDPRLGWVTLQNGAQQGPVMMVFHTNLIGVLDSQSIHLGIRTLNARIKEFVFNRLGSGETFLIKEATLAIKQE